MFTKYKSFLIPTFFAFVFASFYIIWNPGEIKSDAKEYDDLAISILQGKYEINGTPSMEREPGYPIFRAILKTVSDNPTFILWVQAVLYFLTVIIIGLTMQKLDPDKGHFAVWGAALAYSLSFYPSVHLSEILVAFLLSLLGLVFINALENTKHWHYAVIGILSGILLLTRYPYILVPLFLFSILGLSSIRKKIDKKIVIKNTIGGLFIVFAFVFPWVTRNYIVFNEINVAGRSGAIMYARAWKADKSWRSLGESYLSAMVGRGLLFHFYPNNQSIWLDQWGDWWRNKETVEKLWGKELSQIDANRKKAAKEIITKDFNTFAKLVVWTGVDELRLLQLPNPLPQSLGSPIEGTYGPDSKSKQLSVIKIFVLMVAHLAQLLWFMAIGFSTYWGFKKYGFKFVPGIFLISILLPHSIADNIARYGAPLQPWILSGIFIIIFPKITIWVKRLSQ